MPSMFNFGSVYYFLVETMPQMEDITSISDGDSSEDEEQEIISIEDPFEESEGKVIKSSKKLRRGLQYVKSGYVRNVKDCLPDKVHFYKSQVRASMRERAYIVKAGISQISGTIFNCACDDACPQSTLQRCSHISALLLFLLLHKNLNGPLGKSATFRKEICVNLNNSRGIAPSYHVEVQCCFLHYEMVIACYLTSCMFFSLSLGYVELFVDFCH